ncbi:MAG: hypothetical protein IKN20_08735 [Firmicutes bacterium]|nr:hypothetical protein [Bacillota bacterium]
MKKLLSLLLCFVLILGLAACAAQDAPAEEPAERSIVPAEDQIDVIAANSALWLLSDSVYTPFYAVTDLDGDGLLELICDEPGDNWSNVDTFFEIGEDGKTLVRLAFPFGEDHSHPDLVDQDAFRMYIGQEGRYLIANDDIYMGPVQASNFQAYHVLDSLFLGENGVEVSDIVWCMMLDEDTNGDGLSEKHIYYYPGGDADATLDGEGYVNAVSERFSGYEEQVCRVGWWSLGEDTELDDEALKSGLSYSWEEFSVEPDAELFESLVGDPYYTFYAAGAGGSSIYREGEEVPYFPSFMDVRGTWYLQSAWTDEATWYVGKGLSAGELTILDDGTLYADYYNEYDPRGAYLLSEMHMTRDAKADGTDGDDWVVVYESGDGLWQLQLRPDPENQALNVVWYEWEDASRSKDPIGINLLYSRIAG